MNSNQEQVWGRLKYGLPTVLTTVIQFTGNGIATKFNSSWLSGTALSCITIDDVVQDNFMDFRIVGTTIIFKKPPTDNAQIKVEVYT